MTTTPTWPKDLVRWFERDHRPMPWRSDPSPYKVWVSEIMLQQTQVVTVIPYFDRFVLRFPSFAALAAADPQDILKLWEGLGYYSRARNLQQAARIITTRHGGTPPHTAAALLEFPGIGPYTAAAIASIAFGEPVPTVDGNVLRVFSRFWGLANPLRDKTLADTIRCRLAPLIRTVNPSHFNQAMMETGALVCRPRNPDCAACLLARHCKAFNTNRTGELPVTTRAVAGPHHAVVAAVIMRRGRLLIACRHEKGMLGGLWEFPGGRPRLGEPPARAIRRLIREETGLTVTADAPYRPVKHAYSHFRITLTAFPCVARAGRARTGSAASVKWIRPAELPLYPMSRAMRRIADAILTSPTGAGRG